MRFFTALIYSTSLVALVAACGSDDESKSIQFTALLKSDCPENYDPIPVDRAGEVIAPEMLPPGTRLTYDGADYLIRVSKPGDSPQILHTQETLGLGSGRQTFDRALSNSVQIVCSKGVDDKKPFPGMAITAPADYLASAGPGTLSRILARRFEILAAEQKYQIGWDAMVAEGSTFAAAAAGLMSWKLYRSQGSFELRGKTVQMIGSQSVEQSLSIRYK